MLLVSFGVGIVAGVFLGRHVIPVPVPEVVPNPADGSLPQKVVEKHDRKESEIHLPAGAKMTTVNVSGLRLLKRYAAKDRVFSVESGGEFNEDLVLGFADGASGDNVIWLCKGKTASGADYQFYSIYDNCWGESGPGKKAGFALQKRLPGPMHLPVYNCLNAKAKTRYPSLNAACEAEGDTIQEVLGYVRAARIAQAEAPPAASAPVKAAPATGPQKK